MLYIDISCPLYLLHRVNLFLQLNVIVRFGLVFLFYDILTFMSYLMPKPSLKKNKGDIIQLIALG